jgi:peroxiredoxin
MAMEATERVGGAGGPVNRLPALSLPSAPGGEPVAWRAPAAGSPVVVFLRSPDCEDCGSYLRDLAAKLPDLRAWDGRPLVVVPGGVEEAARVMREAELPFPVLADPDGRARSGCGVAEGMSALFIADRWGVVYHAAQARAERDLPPPDEIEDWLRFIATQCPECGVPDEPGPATWAS